MHCGANTLNGQFAFRATYEDGSSASELDFLWDELPVDKRISRLEILDSDGFCLAELEGHERYCFSNEATSVSNFVPNEDGDLVGTLSVEPILSAKIIIGVTGDMAVRYRVDLLSESGAHCSGGFGDASRLKFSDSAYRPGCGQES
jgi:hypothetical protein